MAETISTISLGTDRNRAQRFHSLAVGESFRAELMPAVDADSDPSGLAQPWRLRVPTSDREDVRILLRKAAHRPMDLDQELLPQT
ncbi:MAG: hypothetical protein ACI8Y4_000387 [Candidatus Poriferisodalaceae bacterium]|jgi:hypothetical protein